jgi:HprK-related kinase A
VNPSATPDDIRAIEDVVPAEFARALAGPGVWLDVGAVTLHARSDSALLARHLQAVYARFPFVVRGDWVDVHVHLSRSTGLRRWIRPQVTLRCDGRQPFEPFPADTALPLFEWGCNWMIGERLNNLLLLHAGAVERDGLALVLPATPGSGKSTLTAALAARGWRLLSDEFGAFDPDAGTFRALLKPVALKNESIDVIRRFAPDARFGPEFPRTRKGTVAHLAAPREVVDRRHEHARPGAFILPKWVSGSPVRWEPLSQSVLFGALAFNAFNYAVLGATGFSSVIGLVRRCPGWQLVYGDLEDALAAIDAAWPGVRERHAAPRR